MAIPTRHAAVVLLLALLARPAAAQATVAETDAEPVLVRGSVTDESGEPIAGATLALQLRLAGSDEDRWVVVGESQADGRFELAVKPEWTKRGPFNEHRMLWCYRPGFFLESASTYKQINRRDPAPIDLVLRPAVTNTLRFLLPDGAPLPHAPVTRFYYLAGGYMPPPDAILDAINARTDADGVVDLACCEREKLYSVSVTAAKLGEQRFQLDRSTAGRPTLRLGRTGAVRIQLTGEGIDRYEGAFLAVEADDLAPMTPGGVARSRFDASGAATLEPLATGAYRLFIRDPEQSRRFPVIPEQILVRVGETTSVDLPLKPAVRVRGAVIAEGGEQPAEGARVSVRSDYVFQSQSVLTDNEGRYEAWVLPGNVRASAVRLPEAYSDWIRDRTRTATATAADDATEVELPGIYLLKPTELSGTLVDEQGEPIADYQVSAHAADEFVGMAVTNADGVFTMKVAEGMQPTRFMASGRPFTTVARGAARLVSRDPLRIEFRRSGVPMNVTVKEAPTPPEKLRAPAPERQAGPANQPVVVFAENAVIAGGKAGDFVDAHEYLESFENLAEIVPAFAITQGLVRDREAYQEARLWTRGMRTLFGFQGGGVINLWGSQKSAVYDNLQPGDQWPPADAVVVRGKVVDAEGQPAEGAQVLLIEPPPPGTRRFGPSLYLTDGLVSREDEHTLTHTDADGKFALAVARPEQFGLIVLHPAGYAEEPGFPVEGADDPIQLAPWARVVASIDQGAERPQSLSVDYYARGFVGLHGISISQSSAKGEQLHEFLAVPPGKEVSATRTYWHEDHAGVTVSPSRTRVVTKPGVTTYVQFGPLSDAEKQDIEQEIKRYGPQ